MNNQKEYN